MRTHRSLKRRGLPWPRWALRGRLWRPNSSSWLKLSGSSMWGSSSPPRPGIGSGSSSSSSISGLVGQLMGGPVLVSVFSSLDPAAASRSGPGALEQGKTGQTGDGLSSINTHRKTFTQILDQNSFFLCFCTVSLDFQGATSQCCCLWFLTTPLLSTYTP